LRPAEPADDGTSTSNALHGESHRADHPVGSAGRAFAAEVQKRAA
jgi:hypothetical protein